MAAKTFNLLIRYTKHLSLVMLSMLCFHAAYTQELLYSFKIVDEESSEAIEDVHIFLSNSSIGVFTDASGEAELLIPDEQHSELVISHLAYELQIVQAKDLARSDQPIKLTRNSNTLPALTISSPSLKQWKKNYKKFERAFLGDNQEAKKCSILNPEVLHFISKDKGFIAIAEEPILIENNHLFYQVRFNLNHFELKNDGSSEYKGYAYFEDIASDKTLAEKKREASHLQSPRHFFKALVSDAVMANGYKVSLAAYQDQNFVDIGKPKLSSLVTYDSIQDVYLLGFNEFLAITDTKQRNTESSQSLGVSSGREATLYANSQGNSSYSKRTYAKSYLYSTKSKLRIDAYGHVIDADGLKEYGEWANLRIAHLLPWDYGTDWKAESSSNIDDFELLSELLYGDESSKVEVLKYLDQHWKTSYIAPLLELVRMSSDQSLISSINNLLQKQTPRNSIPNFYEGLRYLWNQEIAYDSYYPNFKAEVYQHIDAKFYKYFKDREAQSSIRFDEVLWGGVVQDGIPPLRYPNMISAKEADYLDDEDVVFGVSINGLNRAYPKRILAWHEFFVDRFEDLKIAGVYCTLCGTVILYDMTFDNVFHDLGTSGFLYRSNKLMYDQASQSLWSTLEGKPVIGPLVNQGIELNTYPSVTTTWGEWKALHPDTEVLSLETGHKRNYDEGVAYSNYYATDELMFPVPLNDKSLANKAEVFAIRIPENELTPKVFDVKFLQKKKLLNELIGGVEVVLIADKSGAVRAYHRDKSSFILKKDKLYDQENRAWEITEDYLISTDGLKLERLPAHKVFWFAWINAFPHSELVDK